MNHDNTRPTRVESANELAAVQYEDALDDDEIETTGDVHRLAAHHFAAAAKFHLLAATAADEGDKGANARFAYLAYRQQLNAVQYAEIAVMDNESLEEDETI